ncbi:MAG TPA: hypothetical protein VHN80_28970, partial [Kineosporiaceae bacterium]|nr:hypothetical protein [Kineosporiaceae bacterium]
MTHSGHDPEQLDDPRAVHIDLVAAAHGLPTDDYTFAYVTGWAAGVDRAEPERVVRDTGVRVLAAANYTFPYVTGWASEVDRAEPERVVRETGTRVLAASRSVLALTQPELVATAAGEELTAGAQLGTERTTAAREHAGATLALA